MVQCSSERLRHGEVMVRSKVANTGGLQNRNSYGDSVAWPSSRAPTSNPKVAGSSPALSTKVELFVQLLEILRML